MAVAVWRARIYAGRRRECELARDLVYKLLHAALIFSWLLSDGVVRKCIIRGLAESCWCLAEGLPE